MGLNYIYPQIEQNQGFPSVDDVVPSLGEIVQIVGINSHTNGHSCEEHHTCGCVLEEDSLIQLQKHQVYINGHEQSAVGVYWVSDGMDRCLVGYLHRHQVKHLNKLEGALCQVTEVYSDNSDSPTKWHKHKKNFGCAIAAIVSSNEPNKVRKGRNKLQSPPKTPTNVDTPTNTNSTSPKQKRSLGNGTENSRRTKNRKLSV